MRVVRSMLEINLLIVSLIITLVVGISAVGTYLFGNNVKYCYKTKFLDIAIKR